jgi:hypothetical protein
MALFIDVDAAVKLAHWDMLSELPRLTQFAWTQCGTVSSLKFRAARSATKADGRLFKSEAAAQSVVAAVQQMQVSIPQISTVAELQDLPGIDPGEAVLLEAVAAAEPGSRLLTGDRRALKALASLPATHRQRYSGKIWMLEQIVMCSLKAWGLKWVQERICANRSVDTGLALVFGSRCDAPEVSVIEGLESYGREMSSLCEPTLLSSPPSPTIMLG